MKYVILQIIMSRWNGNAWNFVISWNMHFVCTMLVSMVCERNHAGLKRHFTHLQCLLLELLVWNTTEHVLLTISCFNAYIATKWCFCNWLAKFAHLPAKWDERMSQTKNAFEMVSQWNGTYFILREHFPNLIILVLWMKKHEIA